MSRLLSHWSLCSFQVFSLESLLSLWVVWFCGIVGVIIVNYFISLYQLAQMIYWPVSNWNVHGQAKVTDLSSLSLQLTFNYTPFQVSWTWRRIRTLLFPVERLVSFSATSRFCLFIRVLLNRKLCYSPLTQINSHKLKLLKLSYPSVCRNSKRKT